MPGKGGPGGGNMVEYLGQYDTPLHFQGDALKGKKAEDFFLKDGTIPDPRSTVIMSSILSKPSSSAN